MKPSLPIAAAAGAALALVARHVGRREPIVICPRFAASSGGGCVPLERVEREWAQTRDLELAHALVREYTRRGDRAQQLRVVGEMIDAGDDVVVVIGCPNYGGRKPPPRMSVPEQFFWWCWSRSPKGLVHASTTVPLQWAEDGIDRPALWLADAVEHVLPAAGKVHDLVARAIRLARSHAIGHPWERDDFARLDHELSSELFDAIEGARSLSDLELDVLHAASWLLVDSSGGSAHARVLDETRGAAQRAGMERAWALSREEQIAASLAAERAEGEWQAQRLVDWATGRLAPPTPEELAP